MPFTRFNLNLLSVEGVVCYCLVIVYVVVCGEPHDIEVSTVKAEGVGAWGRWVF